MSDLQDAINHWNLDTWGDETEARMMKQLVDATRRVAGGVDIRYCAWHEARMAYRANQCQDPFDSLACAPGDYLLVSTEETL